MLSANMETSLHAAIATIILLSATALQFVTACPVSCECTKKQVSCVNVSISAVPSDIPRASEVQSLDLHGNKISSLAKVFHNFVNIQVLDLSYNNLSIILHEDFQNNAKLTNINLQSNVITGVDPGSFRALQELEVLEMGNNSLSTLPAGLLQGLTSLRSLGLQQNHLANLSANTFNSLQSLTLLDLSGNEIRGIQDLFEDLLNLTMLDVSNNKIQIVDGQSFHGNNSIAHLNMSHNSIHILTNLSYMPHLDTLDLSWNNISELSINMFEGLTNLTDLALDGNPLETIEAPVFHDLQNLQTLSLTRMPNLKYLSPQVFDGLGRLVVLNLHHNQLLSFIHKQLFLPLQSISIIDISFNHIEVLPQTTFINNTQLTSLDLSGNFLSCDCHLEWLINNMDSNASIIQHSYQLECKMSNQTVNVRNISLHDLHCSEVKIVNHSRDSKFKIGRSATLQCLAEGVPTPEIIWITPRKRVLHYHNFHEYSRLDYLPLNDSSHHAQFHASHEWHEQPSYYSESEDRQDRIVVLEDGSLYIDYILRSDGGPYRCIAKNPRNKTEIVITLYLDYNVLSEVKIWSFVVGGACAGSFFLLNLAYSLTLAAVRRCISQRRRERIKQIIETMDQYKSMQLTRIKENYTHQVGRIRDQYHYQLGRLRESHQSQMSRMGRMREGASQKVEKLRDNYNSQLGRLKDYSSTQMVQIREKYNSQIYRIKDYGADKFDRIHEKYRLKQQHVIKLLEMMNLDNCKTVFESECVRTESMILGSDIFSTDVPIHSPLDSVSVSDSEYLTATSSESSKHTSRENLNLTQDDNADRTDQVVESTKPGGNVDTGSSKHWPDIGTTLNDVAPSSSKCHELSVIDDKDTYQMVNEQDAQSAHPHAEPLLQTKATSNANNTDAIQEVGTNNTKSGKKRSVKSRKLRESVKRRSKSEMVLKLPQDDCGENMDLLRASSHRHKRSARSARELVDVGSAFSCDIHGGVFDDEQPGPSGIRDSADIEFPGCSIQESTV